MRAGAADIARVAFELHEQKRLSRKELVRILEGCCNLVALENGYADAHGLPFPRVRAKKSRSRRAP